MYKDWPCTWDTNDGIMDEDEILTKSSIGPGVVRCCIENETAGLGPNGNGIEFPNHTSFSSTFKNERIIDFVVHEYPEKTIRLTLIECNPKNGSVSQALEHQEIRWVTIDQMRDIDFCPADKELVEKLFG